MTDIAEARKALAKLIERYKQNEGDISFLSNERQIEDTLIRPLIRDVLHWDIENPAEVVSEARSRGRRIDYLIRNEGISQFVIEAKASKRDIYDDDDAYTQAVGYGVSKERDFAILTNFRQIVILACSIQTRVIREAEIARIDVLEATDEDIAKILWFEKAYWLATGRENPVYGALAKHKKRTPLDEELLQDMIRWRDLLKTNLRRNSAKNKLDFDDEAEFMHIEEEIQKFIDRLVFICFCEDKEYRDGALKSMMLEKKQRFALKPGWLLNEIRELFGKYRVSPDSDLFDKSKCDEFVIDDDKLLVILTDLRQPEGRLPYDFAVIDADILGRAYENFIGHLTKGKKRFKEKEDIGKRKKEGIYYTPKYIVDYIVNHAVREYLKGKSFEEIKEVRIVDPACGSGSFLLRAFDVLVEESANRLKRALTYAEKRELMLNCVYGVDLDKRAVAIAKLNLALKLAERNQDLPRLRDNIVHGNSLIDDRKIDKTNAFVWEDEFPDIMRGNKFDIVIGNPPYIAWSEINRTERIAYESGQYGTLCYSCRPNHKDSQPNYYLFFMVKGESLLHKEGILSFIIPQEWLFHNYAQDFRNFFLHAFGHIDLVKFSADFKVFQGAGGTVGTTSVIATFSVKGNQKLCWTEIAGKEESVVISELSKTTSSAFSCVPFVEVIDKSWILADKITSAVRKKVLSRRDLVFLSDRTHFEVKGGFQPPVEVLPRYTLSGSESRGLNAEEKKRVYSVILDAYQIRRYFLQDIDSYWVIANEFSSDNEFASTCPKLYALLKGRFNTTQKGWWAFPNVRNLPLFQNYDQKLLAPRTASRTSFALDDAKHVFKGTNTMVIVKKISILYVLGILNCALSDWWYSAFGADYHGGQSKKYEPEKVKMGSLPIRLIDFSNKNDKHKHDQIVKLVEKMLDLHKRLQQVKDNEEKHKIEKEIAKTDAEINDIVYDLYGITAEERKIVEEASKKTVKETEDSQ